MQVVTIKKRTIIRQTAILLLCGAAGWYLKGKLSPQVPMMTLMSWFRELKNRTFPPKRILSAMLRQLTASICALRLPDMSKKFCFRKARW